MEGKKSLLVAAALLASACATAPARPEAAAAPGATAQAGTTPAAAEKKPRMICRTERVTGSNIAQVVCRPEVDDRENVQRLQDQLRNWRGQWLRGG